MDNAMNGEGIPEERPSDVKAFEAWFIEILNTILYWGTQKTSVLPTTHATRWYVLLEGVRFLRKENPSLLQRLAAKMPPKPETRPDSIPWDYFSHVVLILNGARYPFPAPLYGDLRADLLDQADDLRKLAERIGRRRGSR